MARDLTHQSNKLIAIFFICGTAFSTPSIFAQEQSALAQNFGATLGFSYEYGQLGNNGMALEDRTMTAISLEALAGYKITPNWLLGLDLNYRFQNQLDSLSDAGGTNLRGNSWLLGLGTQYRINNHWAIQGAVDFIGRYNFDNKTYNSDDAHLAKPLSLRIKGQYFIREHWSIDASANYITWSEFKHGSQEESESSNQWMLGAGFTYHFGGNDRGSPTSRSEAQTIESKTLKNTLIIGFSINSYEIDSESMERLKTAAELIIINNYRVNIEGHTDSTGEYRFNDLISLSRAESAKKILLEHGVNPENVSIEGFGPRKPIASNNSQEGRAKNRRIEIHVFPK